MEFTISLHVILLISATFLTCHPAFAQQFTDEGATSSEEFENKLLRESRQEDRAGFQGVLSFFYSTNTTIANIETRLENLEKGTPEPEDTQVNMGQQCTEAKVVRLEKFLGDMEKALQDMGKALRDMKTAFLLQQLLSHPRARLYSGDNFTGKWEVIERASGDCVERKCGGLKKLLGNVKSVETFGTCVRLFKSPSSLFGGWSLAVYPGREVPGGALHTQLGGVKSIGPCLPDEFDGSTIDQSTQLLKKNHLDIQTTVPDLVEFYSFTQAQVGNAISMKTKRKGDLYVLGPLSRVEFLRKEVNAADLKLDSKPTSGMENTDFINR